MEEVKSGKVVGDPGDGKSKSVHNCTVLRMAWLQHVGMKMAYPSAKLGGTENAGRVDSLRTELPETLLSKTGLVIGRSFCPLFAMVIILGAMLWGPWISLAIVVVALLTAFRFV
jgi:hypothetical protein